jgi:hypothetical protein
LIAEMVLANRWTRSSLENAPQSIQNSYTQVMPPGEKHRGCALLTLTLAHLTDVNRRVESLFRKFDVRRVGAIEKNQVKLLSADSLEFTLHWLPQRCSIVYY